MSVFRRFARAVETEYDRRIRAASLVRHYDPTGASHAHGHVEAHNEHIERVDHGHDSDGHADSVPREQEQSAPREATHH